MSVDAKLKHNRYMPEDKGQDLWSDHRDAARKKEMQKEKERKAAEAGKGSEAWLYYTVICLSYSASEQKSSET